MCGRVEGGGRTGNTASLWEYKHFSFSRTLPTQIDTHNLEFDTFGLIEERNGET